MWPDLNNCQSNMNAAHGFFLLELCPVANSDYLGVDISGGMLKQARRKFPEHSFVEGDIQPPASCHTGPTKSAGS
jgi:hypothetical protein